MSTQPETRHTPQGIPIEPTWKAYNITNLKR